MYIDISLIYDDFLYKFRYKPLFLILAAKVNDLWCALQYLLCFFYRQLSIVFLQVPLYCFL